MMNYSRILNFSKFKIVVPPAAVAKPLRVDLKMFFDNIIKLNELYNVVEKHFQKNFSVWLHKLHNVPYRSTPYRM